MTIDEVNTELQLAVPTAELVEALRKELSELQQISQGQDEQIALLQDKLRHAQKEEPNK